MTDDVTTLDSLPIFPGQAPRRAPQRLAVVGDVRKPLSLGVAHLARLPQVTLCEDFVCEEGWRARRQEWQGVAVGALLDAAEPAGAWAEFASGDFRHSLPLAEARRALVALRLNGAPLPAAHGGPMRLIVPGGACFTSVKWLQRITLRGARGPATAETIARVRIAAKAGLNPGV